MARSSLRIERFQSLARVGTAVGGVASELAAQGDALDGVARKLGAVADRAAAREGEIAGTQAALEGKPGLRKSGSIYGEAYDQAAMRTYADQLDTKLYSKAEALSRQHDRDPEALRAGLAQLKEQMLAEDVLDDPIARAAFERSYGRVELGYMRTAEREAQQRQRQEQAAAASTAVATSRANLDRMAYSFGDDEEGQAATAEETKKVVGIVERAEASGAIAPGSAAKLGREIEADRAVSHLKGAFDQLPAGERKAFIEKQAADFKAGKGLAGKLDLEAYERLTNSFERTMNSDDVATTRATNTLRAQATAVQKVAGEGYGIQPAQWDALSTAAADVEGGAETVAALRQEAEWFHTLASRPLIQAEQAVTELKAKTGDAGATALTVERNKRADGLLKNMASQLKEDPLGWSERAGVMGVDPIDFANPETLRNRVAQAEAIGEHYGVQPVYLRPQERAALARSVELGGEAMMTAVTSIAGAFGNRAPQVLREVSKSAPILAHVGGIVLNGGSPELAADVAEATAMRRDANYKAPTWKPAPFRSMAADVLGEAFTADPEAFRAAETTAKTAYEARAYRRGLATDLGDSDSKDAFERSLQEAAGATFDRAGNQYGGVGDHGGSWYGGGSKVVVPPSVRTDRFDQVVGAIRDEDLPKGVVTAAELQDARLLSIGPGRYRVALGDPDSDDPQYVTGADGRYWTLDLNALEPQLRERVPGAFK